MDKSSSKFGNYTHRDMPGFLITAYTEGTDGDVTLCLGLFCKTITQAAFNASLSIGLLDRDTLD